MARLAPSGTNLWAVVKQSRAYQFILFILLPLLVIFQLSIDLTGIHTFSAPYLESTRTVRNAAFERLMRNETLSTGKKEARVYGLTVCAMLHNEVPYIVEWVEFHRLQGADHFVLYNYFGSDLIEYLPMLYEKQKNITIRVHPARFFGKDHTTSQWAETGELAMVDCYVRYRSQSQWLLFTTGGHFTFSAKYGSLREFLGKESARLTAVRIPVVKFGTGGWNSTFRTWLSPNSYSGGVDLLYEPVVAGTEVYPLVMASNTFRAPHRQLDKKFEEVEDCKDGEGKRIVACSETAHLTLLNGRRFCIRSNMSECLSPTTDTFTPGLDLLRADDHTWRSGPYVQSLISLGAVTSQQFHVLDATWYSRIEDTFKGDTYGTAVESAIRALRPRVFVDLGRECDPAALKRGQQMMCPASHPYPFGVFGVKYLRTCCQYDMDAGNRTLTLESGNCFNETQVECTEPGGTQKWLHRSCCVHRDKWKQKGTIISA